MSLEAPAVCVSSSRGRGIRSGITKADKVTSSEVHKKLVEKKKLAGIHRRFSMLCMRFYEHSRRIFSQCITLSFHLASGDRTGCLVAGYDRYVQEYDMVPQDPRSKHLGQCNGLPWYMLQVFLPDESVIGSGKGKEVVPKKSYLP